MARRRDPEGEDARYLAMRRAKMSYREIAKACGVSYRTVWQGVANARERESAPKPPSPRPPDLTIAYGSSCKPLALLTCDDVHPRGPIPKGSACCCGVCHKSGVDDHPALRRHSSDPKPDPKPKPPIEKKVKGKGKKKKQAPVSLTANRPVW